MGDLIRTGDGSGPPAPPSIMPAPEPWSESEEGRKIDFRHYYQLLLRRKWLIVAVLATVVSGTALQVYTATPLYTATARIQIDPESSNVLPYEDPFRSSLYFLATEAYLRTQAEILESRALALRVVKKMHLETDPVFNGSFSSGFFSDAMTSAIEFVRKTLLAFNETPSSSPMESAVADDTRLAILADQLRSGISVAPLRGTRLIEISYTSPDSVFAAAVVNVVTQQYIQQNFDKRFDATTQASRFLEDKLDDLKKKVEVSEERLIAYARENNIVNLDERRNVITQKLEDLSSELTQVESKLISEAALHTTLKDATVENFPQSLKTAGILSLEARLLTLEQEQARLSAKYGPAWPDVVKTDREMEAVQRQLENEKREALQRKSEEYETTRAHRKQLEEALEDQKLRANQLYQDSIQYNILKREVDTNKDLYEGVLQRLKQAGISASLRSSNIHVVDDAQPPRFASWPSKRSYLMTGAFFGLLLGIGLAFAFEFFDNTVKSPEDLEAFVGLPTLSVIPTLENGTGRGLLPARSEDPASSVMDQYLNLSKSQVWEAYRSLRTSILLSHSGRPPQTILVTSALPGEGKTTTSLHTAMVLAQTGARTLLIDMDMRKPAMARLMGIDAARGMSNYLSGNSDLSSQIQPGKLPNLFALAAGPHPPNPAELIGSERMRDGLGLVRDYFKYIVIDSPPVMSVTDPLILANLVDGVVLVVYGGKTPRDAVRKAGDRLESVGARILGALINNVDIRKSEYSYYYRYYYYYDDYGARQAHRSGGA